MFGVGTRLVTSEGAPSLDGVYKLAAIRGPGGWRPAFKLTDDPAKSAPPGRKGLWRRHGPGGGALGDLVTSAGERPADEEGAVHRDLLEEVWSDGAGAAESIETSRARRRADLARLSPGYLDLIEPALYPVTRSRRLAELGEQLSGPGGAGP